MKKCEFLAFLNKINSDQLEEVFLEVRYKDKKLSIDSKITLPLTRISYDDYVNYSDRKILLIAEIEK